MTPFRGRKVKGLGNKVTSSVRCKSAHNSTTKSRRNIRIGRKVVRATGDIPHNFQGQKIKGQGHQAALGGCPSHHLQGRGIFWRPQYTGPTAHLLLLLLLLNHSSSNLSFYELRLSKFHRYVRYDLTTRKLTLAKRDVITDGHANALLQSVDRSHETSRVWSAVDKYSRYIADVTSKKKCDRLRPNRTRLASL